MTPYELLGVAKDASAEAIQRAFKRKAAKAHPDRTGGNGEAMAAINSAYALLSDAGKRERYDRTGQTNRAKDPRTASIEMLLTIAKQLISQGIPNDLVGNIRSVLGRSIADAHGAINAQNAAKAKFERRRGTVKAKKGRNIFDDLFVEQMQHCERNVENAKEQLAIFEAALALLDDFESTDVQQFQQMHGGYQLFTWGTASAG